jgi:Icc-related predicted phosphoesterase
MPYGILDGILPRMESVGSLTLRDAIKRVHPYIHIGGHLHYYGGEKYYDGKTTYYNVSILNDEYEIENEPTIIEI